MFIIDGFISQNETAKWIVSSFDEAKSIYELILYCNDTFAVNRTFTDSEKKRIKDKFFNSIADENTVRRFNYSLNKSRNGNSDSREMYPLFFIPPYDKGAKYRTVTGAIPATHILSSNAYELEALRILHIIAPDDPLVKHMTERTQRRLDTTCFGKFCSGGECYDTSAVALRYYTTVFPHYKLRINRLLNGLEKYHNDKVRSLSTELYLLLALDEISDAKVQGINPCAAAALREKAETRISNAGTVKIPRTEYYIQNLMDNHLVLAYNNIG